jgi:hypothetical protein
MTKHLALRARAIPSLFMLLLSMSFFACQQANDPTPDTNTEAVSGVLQDEQGHSLPEAIIEGINAQSVVLAADTADEDGKFSLLLPVDLTGVKLRVSRADLKPMLIDVAPLVQTAGGRESIMLNGEHDEECCGKISIFVSGENAGVNNAQVKLTKGGSVLSKAHTNDHGLLTFAHLCDGDYGLRIAKDGYKVKEITIGVGADCDSVYQAIALESDGSPTEDTCCGSTFDFVVKNSSGEILDGVQIKLRKGDGDYIYKNTANGAANFTELCEGIYAVRIAKDGYAVMEFSIEVGCNTEGELTKTLQSLGGGGADSCCKGQVTIHAKNADGEFIESAKVKLWKGGSMIKQETMHSGVTFNGLCEGNYSISIHAEGYAGKEFSFELGCSDTLEAFVKTLESNNSGECCDGVFYLIVNKDGTDLKVANATVKLMQGGQIVKTGTTNSDGLVKLEGICEGTYGVYIMREGYTTKSFDGVEFGCSDTLELHKSLVASGGGEDCCTATLKLRIKDQTNLTYLAGATVKIYKGNDLVATVESGAEGWAMKEGLCGNTTYHVVIEKDGYTSKEINVTYTECKILQETIMMVVE